MPAPEIPAAAEEWYEEIGRTQPGDEQRGWPFRIFIGALGHALGVLHDWIRDTDDGPAWSIPLDPDRAPADALPWTAQFNGVRLTKGASEQQHRDEIKNAAGLTRGTADAMRGAAFTTLPDGAHLTVYERAGSPRRLVAIAYDSEVTDAAATEAAVRAQKPAGLVLTFRVDPGWSSGQLVTAYDGQTIGDLMTDYDGQTIGDLVQELPS